MRVNTRSERTSFHIVDASPWPLVVSTSCFVLCSGSVYYMQGFEGGLSWLTFGLLSLVGSMFLWFRDIIREGSYEGNHTSRVQSGLRMGMMLFIVSEVMFFFAFFWGFFWSSMGATAEIGTVWPPLGIEPVKEWEIPFLNTLILLSSGVSVTWAHHAMISGNRRETIEGLVITIVLAIIFTGLQAFEYMNGSFNISDGIFGSTFYMCTGFHGLHVMIGTIMLGVSLVRVVNYEFTKQHHFGFELAVYYWHFVDVVWIFLFVAIYCWGS